MNALLIFFALPVAIILLSSVFVRILKSPIAIAVVTFAIFLIVTFAVFDANFLIATIIYTILSFISAAITKVILCYLRRHNNQNNECIINTNTSDEQTNQISIEENGNICRLNRR